MSESFLLEFDGYMKPTHHDVSAELVRLVLEGGVFGKDNLLHVICGLAEALEECQLTTCKDQYSTYLEEVTWDVFALAGKSLELLEESVRDVLRALQGGVGSSTEGGVDLGGLVNHVRDDGRGRLEVWSESLGDHQRLAVLRSETTHSIVNTLGLLDDNKILGRSLEGV